MEISDLKTLLHDLNLFLTHVSVKLSGNDNQECIRLLTKVLECYHQFDSLISRPISQQPSKGLDVDEDDVEYGDVEAPPDQEDDTEYGDVEAPPDSQWNTRGDGHAPPALPPELPAQPPPDDDYLPPSMITGVDNNEGDQDQYVPPLSCEQYSRRHEQQDEDDVYEEPGQSADSSMKTSSQSLENDRSSSRSSTADDDEAIYSRGLVTVPKTKPADLSGEKCAGNLEKKSPRFPNRFQERYCVLKNHLMFYFDSKKSKHQNGVIDCWEHVLDLSLCDHKKLTFHLQSPVRTFKFRAHDKTNYDMWINELSLFSEKKQTASMTEPDHVISPTGAAEDDDEIYEDTALLTEVQPEEGEEETADVIDDDMYADTAATDEDIYECVDEIISMRNPAPEARPLPQLPPLPNTPHSVEEKLPADDEPTPAATDFPALPSIPVQPSPPPEELPVKKCLESVYPIPEVSQTNHLNFYLAMWDYSANEGDELSFHRGDTVYVVRRQYEEWGWWEVQLGTTVGFVPKSYLMEAFQSP